MSKMSFFPEFSSKMDAAVLEICLDDLGVTAAILAQRLDVDRKTISRWLSGETPVPGSVSILLRAAHSALLFSHQWNGAGMSVDDGPQAIKRMR